MSFWKNLLFYFVIFLPSTALFSMALEFLLGDRSGTAPEWKVGWNPLLWLILVVPWVLPTVLLVPIVHFTVRVLGKHPSPSRARAVLLVAWPVLLVLAMLGLWGPGNFEPGFLGPVALAGLVYGAVFRIPGR